MVKKTYLAQILQIDIEMLVHMRILTSLDFLVIFTFLFIGSK